MFRRGRWRRRADDITEVLDEPPLPGTEDWMYREFVPWPCTLDPERVSEYPWPEQLPLDLQEQLRTWRPEPHQWRYPPVYGELAMAPGCKVGGSDYRNRAGAVEPVQIFDPQSSDDGGSAGGADNEDKGEGKGKGKGKSGKGEGKGKGGKGKDRDEDSGEH